MGDPFDTLERLVAIDSTSGQEGAYAAALTTLLREEGFDVAAHEVAPGRPNLLATPRGAPRPRVVFTTHIDCVPPFLPPRREAERLYGRGAADTKGPLVAMLRAARRLNGGGLPVGLLLVVGEEVDHCGAAHAGRTLDLGGPRLILGEPTSNRVAAAQKGLLKVRLAAEGVAGHSAFPDRGVSAIHRLLEHLEALRREPWPAHAVHGPTTFNVGLLHGGVAANVFAPSATAEVLFRLVHPCAEAEARVRALAPPGVAVEVVSKNDPVLFAPPPGVATCVVPFNSDASYLAPLGEVWMVGPGAIEVAHSVHEHIDRAELEAGAALYERLAQAPAPEGA